jgi:hypothetical protein
MVDNIEIDGLDYDKLIIGIGPVPTIRLSWRDRSEKNAAPAWQPSASQPLTATATSFFGPALQPTFHSAQAPTDLPIEEAPSPEPPFVSAAHPPPLPPQPADPLARFKVMPHLNRPQ